jgi:hypothetical protein
MKRTTGMIGAGLAAAAAANFLMPNGSPERHQPALAAPTIEASPNFDPDARNWRRTSSLLGGAVLPNEIAGFSMGDCNRDSRSWAITFVQPPSIGSEVVGLAAEFVPAKDGDGLVGILSDGVKVTPSLTGDSVTVTPLYGEPETVSLNEKDLHVSKLSSGASLTYGPYNFEAQDPQTPGRDVALAIQVACPDADPLNSAITVNWPN